MTQENSDAQPETVMGQVGVITQELTKLASMVGDIAVEKAHQANAAAAEFADTASARAEPYVAEAAERYEQTQDAVRRNPTMALGLAAGAGVLLARVFLRR